MIAASRVSSLIRHSAVIRLLLDEIISELVKQAESDQTILSSTDLSMFEPEFIRSHHVWRVENGMVNPND